MREVSHERRIIILILCTEIRGYRPMGSTEANTLSTCNEQEMMKINFSLGLGFLHEKLVSV